MSQRLWDILISSFPRLLGYGLKVTLPLTALSFALALLISVIVAMIQYAKVPVLRQVCRFYIWIVRGTPLLVQLFLVFYGLPQLGVVWAAFPTAVVVFGKGTSLAASITVMEMFRQAQVINGRVYESLALYSETALIYLMFSTVLTYLQRWGEKKLGQYGGVK